MGRGGEGEGGRGIGRPSLCAVGRLCFSGPVFERSCIKEVEVAESLLSRKPGPLTEVAGTLSRIHVRLREDAVSAQFDLIRLDQHPTNPRAKKVGSSPDHPLCSVKSQSSNF